MGKEKRKFEKRLGENYKGKKTLNARKNRRKKEDLQVRHTGQSTRIS
jgi:hypothetical protein